jgi:hypothetical protein
MAGLITRIPSSNLPANCLIGNHYDPFLASIYQRM